MIIKSIPGFKDYRVSDNGIVFSTSKRANRGRPKFPIVRKTFICSGYPAVHLQKNKKAYKRYVHRLVLESFVGKCPKGYQCRHLDGNPLNCNLGNLRWGTRKENQNDRITHGTDNRGIKHGMNKLTESDVLLIFKLANQSKKNTRIIDKDVDYRAIAKKFNVSPTTIGNIVAGKTWRWLTRRWRAWNNDPVT